MSTQDTKQPTAAAEQEPWAAPRIPAQQALDIILAQVRERLVRHEAFSNTSVAYYAVGYDFRIDFDLYGREVTKASLAGKHRTPYDDEGRPIALPVAVGLPQHAAAARKGQVGKDKPRLQPGSHVVGRQTTSPEQRAMDKDRDDRAALVGAGVPAGTLGAEAAQAPKE